MYVYIINNIYIFVPPTSLIGASIILHVHRNGIMTPMSHSSEWLGWNSPISSSHSADSARITLSHAASPRADEFVKWLRWSRADRGPRALGPFSQCLAGRDRANRACGPRRQAVWGPKMGDAIFLLQWMMIKEIWGYPMFIQTFFCREATKNREPTNVMYYFLLIWV